MLFDIADYEDLLRVSFLEIALGVIGWILNHVILIVYFGSNHNVAIIVHVIIAATKINRMWIIFMNGDSKDAVAQGIIFQIF